MDHKRNPSSPVWLAYLNQQFGFQRQLLLPHSARLIASGRVTAALPWAYRSPYTLAFLYFDKWYTYMYINTCTTVHVCLHSYSQSYKICTHTHSTFNPSPTWINSPAAPENASTMMSPAIPLLQKHLTAISTKSKHTLSLLPLSLCPLIVIPQQKVHTQWRENYRVCCTIRYSWVSAH